MLDLESYLRSDQLFDGQYRLIRSISTEGPNAEVWLALDANTIDINAEAYDESSGKLVAIKVFRLKSPLDEEHTQRFRDKFKMAHRCRHVNLLPPEAFSIHQGIPYLVYPYCEAGSSEHLIRRTLPQKEVWKFIDDVASGIDRLHHNNPPIVHQDIKPGNILIDNNGNFTITDFGIYADGLNSRTLAYLAPECFDKNMVPTPKSDIWAFGATLCEILTGQVPFGENGGLNQKRGIKPIPAITKLPSRFKNLILDCLDSNPDKRPTAAQIKEAALAKNNPSKKKVVVPAAILALLLLAGITTYLLTRTDTKQHSYTYSYDQTLEMLQNTENDSVFNAGWHHLDSLVAANNFNATFLKSRLCFDHSNPRDTLFYDPTWTQIQSHKNLLTNQEEAHRLLYEAFSLNENDCPTLFQLGCDYHAPNHRRGCEQNIDYALWCFQRADSILNNTHHQENERYREKVKNKIENITNDPTISISPKRPTHP